MFRGTTDLTVVSALAVVVLTLRFFALTAPFADAHTASHAKARARTLQVFRC